MEPTYTLDRLNRIKGISESVIREMTRKAEINEAINLSQGYPGYQTPKKILDAAKEALADGHNQYSVTWGIKELREGISEKLAKFNHLEYDPETEVTVTCGTSEALMSSILAHIDPGDEVLLFQPFYENYVPAVYIASGKPVFTSIDSNMKINQEDIKSKVNHNTKAIVLNTPHNPTGKVFSHEELKFIRDLCVDNDTLVITDEIYERIVFDGEHISLASLDGMREKTIAISGFSKTYSVTGWRVGYAAAPMGLMNEIRKVHDYTTVCAPTPFQKALCKSFEIPERYYRLMLEYYKDARDYLYSSLKDTEFKPFLPHGAYYMMVAIDHFGMNDIDFADHLVKNIGVAVVPGTSFYDYGGDNLVRFCFSPPREDLEEAVSRLEKLRTFS